MHHMRFGRGNISYSEHIEQLEQVEVQLADARIKITELEGQIKELHAENSRMTRDYAARILLAEQAQERLQHKVDQLTTENTDLKEKISGLESANLSMKEEVKRLNQLVDDIISDNRKFVVQMQELRKENRDLKSEIQEAKAEFTREFTQQFKVFEAALAKRSNETEERLASIEKQLRPR